MSTRKKSAVLPRQGKRVPSNGVKAVPYGPPRLCPRIEAMLRVGEEQVIINQEADENIGFMTEYIDTL